MRHAGTLTLIRLSLAFWPLVVCAAPLPTGHAATRTFSRPGRRGRRGTRRPLSDSIAVDALVAGLICVLVMVATVELALVMGGLPPLL